MALDGHNTDMEAARAAFTGSLEGQAISTPGMVAIKDGFPPGHYDAVTPAEYHAAIVSGEIAMEETLFAKAHSVLEAHHGPAQSPGYSQQFGASAAVHDNDVGSLALKSDMSLSV